MNQEVLIIGGGVIGLSIARELHRKGVRQITIVDRGTMGREASWAAAGMLAPNIETDTHPEFHRFGIESLELYPGFSEALLEETGIDIELDRTGTLFLAFDETEESAVDETFTLQRSRGVNVELMTGTELRELEPMISHAAGPALLYPDDWQVENRLLVDALIGYAERNGIRIVENTEVVSLLSDGIKVIGASTIERDVLAGVTIIATGAWTSLIKIRDVALPVDVRPIRGQMISFQVQLKVLRHVVYSTAGYLVPRADGRILVGATVEDVGFENAVTQEGLESLVMTAIGILPDVIPPLRVSERWSGLRPFAPDGLPVIGTIPGFENLIVATAHYRNGILLAPKTAEIIAEKIIDQTESPVFKLCGVERFSEARATVNR
jgi:glycine oxidase